jgi:hypothetical protein
VATYRVWNNTDLREGPFVTHNHRQAQRVWIDVKPRRTDGDRYVATFTRECDECGGQHQERHQS